MTKKKADNILYEHCRKLVQSVTKFEENDENFQISLDFTLSNLLYHTYPDVNSHAVNRWISGMHDRFLMRSELEKAKHFSSLSRRLLDKINECNISEKEKVYRVLSLLFHLAGFGDEKQEDPKAEICDNDAVEKFDWAAYLREDDERYSTFSDNNSELFSSDESCSPEVDHGSEDGSVNSLPHSPLHPPPRDDSGIGISPDSCSGTSQHFHAQNQNLQGFQDGSSSVLKVIQNSSSFYPYWLPKYQKTYFPCRYDLRTMNFTKRWEEFSASQNLFNIIERKVIVHERNVIKEILWMLSGVKDVFILQWNGSEFLPNAQIHLCELTSKSLGKILKEFCEYGTKIAVLRDFVNDVQLRNSDIGKNCHTFQAYTEAIKEQIQRITNQISDLDKILRDKRKTFTLLVLRKEIKPILDAIDLIYLIHQETTGTICASDDPFGKMCKILQVLWELLCHQSLREQMSSMLLKIILTVFLRTCTPLFSFLEELMFLGTFKDSAGEYFLVRKKDVIATDEEYWEKAFILRPLPPEIEKTFFLKPFLEDVICAGKTIEILNQINSMQKKEPFRLYSEKGDLYLKFVHILQKSVSKEKHVKFINGRDKKETDEKIFFMEDPLLKQKIFSYSEVTGKFFKPDINPVYRCVARKVPVKLFSEKQTEIERIIHNLKPNSMKSLSLNILKAFDICMQFAYYPTCRRLVKALKEDHNLMIHMNIMQKYFLMESGDLMFSFYSKVFEKIFYHVPWQDVSFLYSALQNAVGEDKGNCEKLFIFLDSQNADLNATQPLSYLNTLQLSYEVEWPVTIMLGSHLQNQYNGIFSFLLQIKCAKYLLDKLYSTKISIVKESKPAFKKRYVKVDLPRQQKIHGMYIIRMRLMFFVNGLHNYIMTRILHSFGLEIKEKLENSQTVDDMIVAHNEYLKSLHNRCLLDRRLTHLKQQILQVLNLCYTFQQLWLRGVDDISLEKLQAVESDFSKINNFLICCCNVQRRMYPHLDNLMSTMLSETHSLRVFECEPTNSKKMKN